MSDALDSNSSIDHDELALADSVQKLLDPIGVETVEDVAEHDTKALDSTLSGNLDHWETVDTEALVAKAYEVCDVDSDVVIGDDAEDEPEQSAEPGAVYEETVTDSADAFLDAGSEPENPMENYLVIAGDGICDHDGQWGEFGPERVTGAVQKALFELGVEDMETMSAIKGSMGWPAVKAWVEGADDEDLPANFRKPFAPNFEAHDGTIDALEAMRERALEWADVLVVVGNGDYVGYYISSALETDSPTEIRSVDEE